MVNNTTNVKKTKTNKQTNTSRLKPLYTKRTNSIWHWKFMYWLGM